MLQQTRVETVIPYWLKWMRAFPNVQALASASEADVFALWAGLGYYRRASNLLKGAQQVVADFKGIIPHNVESLKSIKGIGDYTAGAIASIAFNEPVPLVDG
ncbi:MAG: A/G-specific adenine glycosylase, partial [Methanosarcinales archaeon]